MSKAPSDLEVVLGLIKSNSKGLLDAEGVSAARKQLQLLEVSLDQNLCENSYLFNLVCLRDLFYS